VSEITEERPKIEREGMRKGIYILPNLFTAGSLFAGFYCMVSSLNGDYRTAAVWILVSSIFDGLDGKVARLTGTASKFGVEFDSLADVVSFGAAPGLLMYSWALKPFGRLGWLAGFLFLACAALRLARFNVQVDTVESKRFVGLPTPAAASMVSATVLFFYHLGWPSSYNKLAIIILIYFLALLMVSNVRYYSFKDPSLIKRQPFVFLVVAVLLLVVIAAEPVVMLFTIFICYILSGPVGFVMTWPRRRRLERAMHKGHEQKLNARKRL
jgi:CDP-diacylglycerol---serine O-phosphatidyltransferase